jgi:predicted metalloprotease
MTFNSGAQLDPDQVTDARGRSYGGGRGLAVGGGGIGLVIAIVYLLLGGDPSALLTTDQGAVVGPNSSAIAECKSGTDANTRDDCRIVGFVNSIQAYWTSAFQAAGSQYRPAQTFLFDNVVDTGCGTASSQSGPFYCPTDGTVYLDLGFFSELHTKFGAEGGPLAQAYVVAHEYGHHVQDLQGKLQAGSGGTGAESTSVRTELQADCYAGVWVNHAASTGFLQPPTSDQVGQALDAAKSVGDDRIQEATQGQVDPDSWTHGSADQRQHWFTVGFESGQPAKCDTFSGDI